MSKQPHGTAIRRLPALRAAALTAIVLAAAALVTPTSATAAPQSTKSTNAEHRTVGVNDGVICVPESVSLYDAYTGQGTCFAVPTASIDPPFHMTQARNGTSYTWCLYNGPDYTGTMILRLQPYGSANVTMYVASATYYC